MVTLIYIRHVFLADFKTRARSISGFGRTDTVDTDTTQRWTWCLRTRAKGRQKFQGASITRQAPATLEMTLRLSNELQASFAMIGSHGHEVTYSTQIGSVRLGVLVGATCPVVVVPYLSIQALQESGVSV